MSFFGTPNTQNSAPGTGGSLFGAPQPNTGQTGTTGSSLFGNLSSNLGGGALGTNTTAQQQQPAFGSTPNPQQQQPATGGLFGSTTPQPNLFGNLSAQQQPATGGLFSQPAAGGLFGNTGAQQQQPAAGGLFGNTNPQQQPTGGSMFGGISTTQPAGGSLFGNAQPSGSSLFGNITPQPATGSLFGNTAAQQPSGGSLFGSQATQQQPAAGTGLFGNTASQQPSSGSLFGNPVTQQQPTTSLFGSTTTQAPATGGLFGNTSTQAPTTGGLFGGTTLNPAAAPSTGTSLFGQSTARPTFVFAQPQAKPTGTLFGSTNPTATTGNLFGSTLAPSMATSSLLAPRASQMMQQQGDPQAQLMQKIDAIAEAWNPNSPQCRFQHYFYNLVDPGQVSLYGRPSNATNETLWQKAVREIPDPSCLVPVLALGFDALNTRVEAQTQQAATQQEKLKELKKRLETLKAAHNDSNVAKIRRAMSQNTQISHRLLKLIQHLHLLIPAVRSSAIRPEEETLRVALEEMEEEIRRPGGTSRMRSKLNELWALVGAVSAAKERGRKTGFTEWTVVDEDGLKQITQILADQQTGLEHLTQILQRDLKDLKVIMGNANEEGDLNS